MDDTGSSPLGDSRYARDVGAEDPHLRSAILQRVREARETAREIRRRARELRGETEAEPDVRRLWEPDSAAPTPTESSSSPG